MNEQNAKTFYERQTHELVSKLDRTEEIYRDAVQTRCSEMSAQDHIRLLEEIVAGHIGGRRIKISYRLFMNAHVKELLQKSYLNRDPWVLKIKPAGVTLSNFEIPRHNFQIPRLNYADGYDEYSYRRYKMKNNQFLETGFYTSDVSLEKDLVLFSRRIRVSVLDLLVPKNQICSPMGTICQGSAMPYNESFELP